MQGRCLFELARGGDFKQMIGHCHQIFFRLSLARLPSSTAKLIELHGRFTVAKAREDLDILNWYEELISASIFNF